MALADAANVKLETRTSSPSPTPSTRSARCSAAVPLDNAAAAGTSTRLASSASKASTCGPSGATQLESNASSNNLRSSSPISGGERNNRLTSQSPSQVLDIVSGHAVPGVEHIRRGSHDRFEIECVVIDEYDDGV